MGRGVVQDGKCRYLNRTTPTPNPSPQGGGEHTEYAALFCIHFNSVPEHDHLARAARAPRIKHSATVARCRAAPQGDKP
jgi:hypothetical protein